MGVEAEQEAVTMRKERNGTIAHTYGQIDKMHKSKKKSGLPIQSVSKKQKDYKCILCKKYSIIFN